MVKALMPVLQSLRDESKPYPVEDDLAGTIDYLMHKYVERLKQRGQRMLDHAHRIEDWGIERSAALETHELENLDLIKDVIRVKALSETLAMMRAQRAGAVHSIEKSYSLSHLPTINVHLTGKERELLDNIGHVVRFERKQGRGTIAGIDMSLVDAVGLRDHLSSKSVLSMAGNRRSDMESLVQKLNAAI